MLAGSRLPFDIAPVAAAEVPEAPRRSWLVARARLHAVVALLGLTALAGVLTDGPAPTADAVSRSAAPHLR
jgi:hypothetical protein